MDKGATQKWWDVMLEERLSLVGGAPRWLNINAAMKVGGFERPDEIYEGIKNGEIDVNETMCNVKDPADERSWIRIEPASFIRWLEKKSQFSLDMVSQKYDNIQKNTIDMQVKLGFIQYQISSLKAEIYKQRVMISNLIEMMTVKKIRSRESA